MRILQNVPAMARTPAQVANATREEKAINANVTKLRMPIIPLVKSAMRQTRYVAVWENVFVEFASALLER